MNYKTPKIAYIVSMVNGLEPFIYREVEGLYKKGLRVILFATKFKKNDYYSPKQGWEYYRFGIVKVLVLFPFLFLKLPLNNLKILIEAIRFSSIPEFMIALYYSSIMKYLDIEKIHCHFGDHKFFIGYYCKKILDLPLSVTIHAHEIWANPNEKMFSSVINEADKIIAISELNKKVLIEKYLVDANKIEVLRLFVDGHIYKKSNKKRVLTVGRFTERKGYDILFDAIRLLNRDDVEFIIVGFGPMDLESLACKHGVSEKVVVFGKMNQKQLRVFFDLCDIYCLPSKTTKKEGKEGIPVVLMEAMAFGMPVVATDNGSVSELIGEILVEENDPKKLVEGIVRLLDSEELCKQQAISNREQVLRYYSTKNLDKLFDIYTRA